MTAALDTSWTTNRLPYFKQWEASSSRTCHRGRYFPRQLLSPCSTLQPGESCTQSAEEYIRPKQGPPCCILSLIPDHTQYTPIIMAPPTTVESLTTPTSKINLMDLPSELHMEIASFLPYPDALALKHTCRHFYSMVYTGVHLKVDWLVERFERKLECPMEKCSFRTDEAFCNWRIRRIMERRRRHLECRRVPQGCWVVEGQTCQADLVPSWLKKGGPKVARSLAFLAREGLSFCSHYLGGLRLTWYTLLAFVILGFALLLELLWRVMRNDVMNWLGRETVSLVDSVS